jgi:hypothetical protein
MTPGKSSVTTEKDEDLVYAPAILILSHDLYPRKLEVIREYIQNSSDALEAYADISDIIEDSAEPQIKVSVQGRSVLIYDNGIGMDREEVAKLRRIAYSEKKVGQEAGYKGIGRLAGIAVADKLKMSSTSYGDSKLHHFEFRAKEMREEVSENKRKGITESATEVIKRHTDLWSDDIDPKDHYTIVEIRDINESCSQLLDVEELREYIGDVGPVDFAPSFKWGQRISEKLRQNIPDYSPKTVYISMKGGERVRVYKPYTDQMVIAEPDFLEVADPANPNHVLAYCWYTTKGQKILDKVRPAGKIFTVEGEDPREKKRFAGLVYKLFGFSIGDRTLPMRTLWAKSLTRAQWFTGEIHIVDKDVFPTTDRSDFIESEARKRLYGGAEGIAAKLNRLAQEISDNRKAYNNSEKLKQRLQDLRQKLQNGQIERAALKVIKQELERGLEDLKHRADKCTDNEIEQFDREVLKYGRKLGDELDHAKISSGEKNGIVDVASELHMTAKAKKVFQIVMDTLSNHFSDDTDQYHEVNSKITRSLRRKY